MKMLSRRTIWIKSTAGEREAPWRGLTALDEQSMNTDVSILIYLY